MPLTAQNFDTAPGFLRCFVTRGVVGVDRTFSTNCYANVQYYFTATDNAEATVNDACSHSITYEVHDTFFRGAFKSGVRGIVSFSGDGLT